MRISVLGAGSWGTTVASVAAHRNDTVLWARDPDVADGIEADRENQRYLAGYQLPSRLHATADLEKAVAVADVLIVGIPSHGFRDVLEQAKPHLRPWVPVVSLTKGFEKGSLLRMTEVVKDVLPGHPAAALSGPNLAKEIMGGQAAASVIATEDLQVAKALQGVLHRGLFRVYINHDVVGCEVGGALKNVVAIAAGMAEGLSVGDNTRAAVMTRGLAELTRLGVAMGGESATFSGLAGLGDLVATCSSPHSRNRYVGEQLGKGRTLPDILDEMKMVAEGVKTAGLVMELAATYNVHLPISGYINSVIEGRATAAEIYAGLLRERPGHEVDPL
jgi:glycerol-3-phosphate dehydrogenase (NAD(P)+)